MENTLIFASEKEIRFTKLLKFIIPTYLTSLFNTVYTIIDGVFVSAYVGTNALASINIVYPIVNVLTGIALVFATGGSAVTALHIGGNRKKEADRSFSCSYLAWMPRFPDDSYESLSNSDYAHRFFTVAPIVIYALTYFLTPVAVSCFADTSSPVFPIAVSGMRIYGLGFLFSGINIFAAIRMMAYGKGYFSGLITFLRSFLLLLINYNKKRPKILWSES